MGVVWSINLNSIILAVIAAAGSVLSVRASRERKQIHEKVNGTLEAVVIERDELRAALDESTGDQ